MLKLSQQHWLSEGKNRVSYTHPEDENIIVKIAKDNGSDANFRELNFYNKMRNSQYFAQYLGKIETNLGEGLMFEKITNFDGSQPVNFNKLSKSLLPLPANLLDQIKELLSSLEKQNLYSCSANPENILLVKTDYDNMTIISCDSKELVEKQFIPINKIPFFKKRMIKRRYKRLLEKIKRIYF